MYYNHIVETAPDFFTHPSAFYAIIADKYPRTAIWGNEKKGRNIRRILVLSLLIMLAAVYLPAMDNEGKIKLFPDTAEKVWAASRNPVYISCDGDGTWERHVKSTGKYEISIV